MKKRILVTDDEPNVRLSYCTVLEVEGYATEEANSAVTALEKLIAGRFDLAILDLRMPEMDGLDLLAQMRERGLSTPTIMITAYYEQALRINKDFAPAQQNELARRGTSKEPFALGRGELGTTG